MASMYRPALAGVAASVLVCGSIWLLANPERRAAHDQSPTMLTTDEGEALSDAPSAALPRAATTRIDPGPMDDSVSLAVIPPDDIAPPEIGEPNAESAFADSTGDLELYRGQPMSSVPHTVARGWGMGSGSSRRGVIGAVVIVDANMPPESLEKLVRDIRSYHLREDAVSVRVMDDAHAATYDRHQDGGALAQRHLVAQIIRNDAVGIDEIRIGDRILEP